MWNVGDRLKKTARIWQNARMLRQLLREQRRTASELQRIAFTLNQIGRLVAHAYHVPWEGPLSDALSDTRIPEEDLSGVSSLDDDFLSQLEAIKVDYDQRYGRQIGDEEAMRVLADHDAATRELQDQHL